MDLDPMLARDTVEVTRLPLCRVLLMKDRRFPWLVLVPERSGVREICELAPADRALLVEEIAQASEVLRLLFRPDKLNVGALGNLVPQLHVHVVARATSDSAWPGPVWGSGAPLPYTDDVLADLRRHLAHAFEAPRRRSESDRSSLRTSLLRASAVWLVLMGIEFIHGALRTFFLAPVVGDFQARQISVFTGSLLILGIACLFIRWLRAETIGRLLAIGLLWLVLTAVFEIGLGRLAFGFPWERIASDYDLRRGGLLPLGLAFLTLSPLLAARLRGIRRAP